jgi:hypothetical protein
LIESNLILGASRVSLEQYTNLSDNPLFVKHLRSRLRKGTLRTSILIIGVLSFLMLFLQVQINAGARNPAQDGGGMFWAIFALQGLILYLMGGSQVAGAVAHIKETGILEFHRVTPIPSGVQALGFLIGAPIREWLLYAITFPFALILALMGGVGWQNFAIITIVQLAGAIFYHTLAIVVGLTGNKSKGASGRYVGLTMILNFASMSFIGSGVHGPFLFSPLPVVIQVQRDIQLEAMQNPNAQVRFRQPPPAIDDPKFFSMELPLVVETLLTQGILISFLYLAIMRRFRSDRIPVYTKKQALSFFAAIAFLTFGTLWDAAGPAIMLGSAYILALTSIFLCIPMTVPLGDFIRGLQRTKKMGDATVPIWSHLASSRTTVLLMGLLSAIGLVAAAAMAPKPNPRGFAWNQIFSPWGPVVVSTLTTLAFGFAYQYLHLKHGRRGNSAVVGYVFIFWIVPILLFGILAATTNDPGLGALVGTSPLFGIGFSSLQQFGPNQKRVDETVMQMICIIPIAFQMVYFWAKLARQERRLKESVTLESAPVLEEYEEQARD